MKPKIRSLVFKTQQGTNRNIEVNGKLHRFKVFQSVDDVIQTLEEEYELNRFDKNEIRMMW